MRRTAYRRIALLFAGAAALGAAVVAGPAHATGTDLPVCTTGQLTGEVVYQGAAAGNRYAELVVTNHGDACTLYGFAGLQLIGADGRLLQTNAEQRPTGTDPSLVTLPGAGSAVADLHWIVGPCFTAGDDGTPESRPVALTVTPPDETTGFTVAWTLGAVCGEIDGPAKIDISAFRAA